MAFNNVENFLNSSNDLSVLAEYDLKNEMQYSNNSSLEKALDYKVSDDGFDCDGTLGKNTCKLIREVYRILWEWHDKNESGDLLRYARTDAFGDRLMGPETLNSFWTSFGAYISNKDIMGINKYLWKRQTVVFNETMSKDKRMEKIYKEASNDIKAFSKNDYASHIEIFSKYVGCIGNMTLTIAGFNRYIANDYWDIKIDLQFLSNQNLSFMFKKKYINMFFLWDYVSVDNNEIVFKPFFKDHSIHNPFPKDEKDVLSVIKKTNSYVIRRGIFMVAMLKIADENSNLYKEIQSEVFSTDKVYSGYDEVFVEILKFDGVIKNNEIKELLEKAQEKIDEIKVD